MVNVDLMTKEFGNSDEQSRAIVMEAHGGKENLQEWAKEWAEHHIIFGDEVDVFIAYAAAVDLGVRIGRKNETT